MFNKSSRRRVIIIGAGQEGITLLEALHDGSHAVVVGTSDPNPLANGLRKAELLGIPIFLDYKEMLKVAEYDMIINASGSEEIEKNIDAFRSDKVEVIGNAGARLIWELIDKHQEGREETKRRLAKFEDLYNLGLVLSSSQNLHQAGYTVIDFATRLTDCPAGSLAIVDEKTNEMVLCAAKGFSTGFHKIQRWKPRIGGLTNYIFNQKSPVVISDIAKFKSFDNPTLVSERIKSIVASPLTIEGRVIGVLYVDDVVEHHFNQEDIFALSLISSYAALAIERTKLLEDTKMMAITDGLTGLYNHRYFFTRLDEEIERAKRYNRPLTLIVFDIDHFKNYNDKQGHVDGNKALREIGHIIKSCARQTDLSARCGGEEFAIIMPDASKTTGLELAERLRLNMETHHIKGEQYQPGGRLTISVGVASMPDDSVNGRDLMDKADQALYAAKRRGRNQVVGYQEGMMPIGSSHHWRMANQQ